jgi:uncharacterized protein
MTSDAAEGTGATRGAAAGSTPDIIRAGAERIAAAGDSGPRLARDPVNLPMIRNWLEALAVPGDRARPGAGAWPDCQDSAPDRQDSAPDRPDTAPPAMIQVWTMPGLHGARADDDPLGAMLALLDEAGYPSIVATNCDQVYLRPVTLGERLAVSARLVDVAGPKRTALGEGWFVTTRSTWTSAGEPVATMDFRVLKYRPSPPMTPRGRPAPSGSPGVIRPAVSPDTEFFWAGAAAGELRVQRCGRCGALRHPPGPRCPACGAMSARPPGYVIAAGTGEVYSYVVHHHPPVPGKKLPVVIALVRLTEGVRMTGELLGAAPGQLRIGLPVRAEFVTVDDELTLPAWRAVPVRGDDPPGSPRAVPPPGGDPPGSPRAVPPPGDDPPGSPRAMQEAPRQSHGVTLPPLVIDVTPTFVVASALATRDFQDVHHDRDRAVAGGARDIFLNILTTTGLVQRYVAAWAGPGSVIGSISVRLGVPCHAGDTLTLTGEVTAGDGAVGASAGDASPGGRGAGLVLSVTGRCRGPGGQVRGDHVTATVRLAPGERR